MNKEIQIPFDKLGNQMSYPMGCYKWKKNYKFKGTLQFKHFLRGCSAANAIFENEKGKTLVMFLKDLSEAIPYMNNGIIQGEFTFVKRGQNYGITLILN